MPDSQEQGDAPGFTVVQLCSLCMAGEGGECHVPGCALYMNRAPDVPVIALHVAPEQKDCICGGTGLVTRLTETGDSGPEVCSNCYVSRALFDEEVASKGRMQVAITGLIADRARLEKKIERLEELLDEMQLHDVTGDPHDEGYMAAVNEIREALCTERPGV